MEESQIEVEMVKDATCGLRRELRNIISNNLFPPTENSLSDAAFAHRHLQLVIPWIGLHQ